MQRSFAPMPDYDEGGQVLTLNGLDERSFILKGGKIKPVAIRPQNLVAVLSGQASAASQSASLAVSTDVAKGKARATTDVQDGPDYSSNAYDAALHYILCGALDHPDDHGAAGLMEHIHRKLLGAQNKQSTGSLPDDIDAAIALEVLADPAVRASLPDGLPPLPPSTNSDRPLCTQAMGVQLSVKKEVKEAEAAAVKAGAAARRDRRWEGRELAAVRVRASQRNHQSRQSRPNRKQVA